MRIFFIFILLTLIGCKQQETPVSIDDISGCIQKEYKGDFQRKHHSNENYSSGTTR